jgi:hypothetical protein
MTIRYKFPEYEAQLARSEPLLREVVAYLDSFWSGDVVLTCVERDAKTRVISAASPPAGFSPHEARPCRAGDVRTSTLAPIQVLMGANAINAKWEYDPARPAKKVALIEDDHLHVQVHAATRLRPPKIETA